MTTIDGKTLVGSGIFHFTQNVTIDAPAGAQIRFSNNGTEPGGVHTAFANGTVTIDLDLTEGESYRATLDVNLAGVDYLLLFWIERSPDLPLGGQFYRGSYTLIQM